MSPNSICYHTITYLTPDPQSNSPLSVPDPDPILLQILLLILIPIHDSQS